MKTKIIELNPTQIEVIYLDANGEPIKDSSQECQNLHWEARFIGADIDPLFVVSIEFPTLSHNADKLKPMKARVVVIDVTPEEAKSIKAALQPLAEAQEVLEIAEAVTRAETAEEAKKPEAAPHVGFQIPADAPRIEENP